jgi:hypothetical protein
VFGSEVEDLDRLVVIAAGLKLAAVCAGGRHAWAGSSRDKVRTVQHYRMGRVW